MSEPRVRVVLFAPFFSGVVLEAERAAGEASTWTDPLQGPNTGGWGPPHDAFRFPGYSRSLERPVSAFIPQFAVERQIAVDPGDLDSTGLGPPSSLRVEFSAYGVGLLVATYEAAPLTVRELPDPRELPKRLQDSYGSAVGEAVREFQSLATKCERWDPNHLVLDNGEQGDFLWAHELLLVESPARRPEALAGALVEDGLPCPIDGHLALLGGAGRSVLVSRARSPEVEATLTHGIALQTAYWAAATRLDLLLVRRQAGLAPGSSTRSVHDIEQEEEELLVLFHHVHFFRTAISGLGGYIEADDYAVWSGLAQRWGLGEKLDALDAKLDALQRVEASLHAGAAAKRERRLSSILFVFTVISGVAVVFSTVDFLENEAGFSDPRSWRLHVAVAVALLAVIALVVGALVLRGFNFKRKRSDPGDTRGR